MAYDQAELQRETIFKDAVLKGAELRAHRIVEQAEMEAQRQIQNAQATCEEADHDTIAATYAAGTAKQMGAMRHNARRELLAYRAQLVDGLFRELREELAAFTKTEGYLPWLKSRLARHRETLALAEQATVYLRAEDMALADALRADALGCACVFTQHGGIRLGGLKVGDGHRLYDETLDAALEEERARFTSESALQIGAQGDGGAAAEKAQTTKDNG